MDSGGCYVVGGEVKTEVVFCNITVCYLLILVVVTSQDCEYETGTVKVVWKMSVIGTRACIILIFFFFNLFAHFYRTATSALDLCYLLV